MSIISEQIKDFGDFELQRLHQFISLIVLVDKNYYHIQELDTVIELLEKYSSGYYNEYYPNILVAAKIALEIGKITKAAHYNDKYKVSDYYINNVVNADLHSMLNFKYEKDTQLRKDKYYEIGEKASW